MQNVEWLMGEWVIPLKTVTTTRAPCGANKFKDIKPECVGGLLGGVDN